MELSLTLLTVIPTALVGSGLMLLLKARRAKQPQLRPVRVRSRRDS
jgi:hypothetical protein